MGKKLTVGKILQFAAILLVLVVLPAGSWFYLKSGFDFRMKALEELQELSPAPAFTAVTAQGDTLKRDLLRGRLTLTTFFDPAGSELAPLFGENLHKLQLQFDDRPDMIFLLFPAADSLPAAEVQSFTSRYQLSDNQQVLFLTQTSPGVEELARRGFRLPLEDDQPLRENSYLALADTNLVVRHYYDIRNPEEIKRLVQHIAILLPQEREKDLVFKPEREK